MQIERVRWPFRLKTLVLSVLLFSTTPFASLYKSRAVLLGPVSRWKSKQVSSAWSRCLKKDVMPHSSPPFSPDSTDRQKEGSIKNITANKKKYYWRQNSTLSDYALNFKFLLNFIPTFCPIICRSMVIATKSRVEPNMITVYQAIEMFFFGISVFHGSPWGRQTQ